MKLILTQDVPNLGIPGDIVEVKDGYGRNYLVPRGLAMAWTNGAEKQVAQLKRARQVREVRDLGHAKEIAAQLEGLTVRIVAKAGGSGQLFGRVTEKDIAEAIKKAGGPDVDRRRIEVTSPVKSVGSHAAAIALHPDVTAKVAFVVTAA
jgi:large subunit ribosomal protein L9